MNSRGGLNCHQIKYLVADDGGDPNRHRAAVQQMVEKDGVIAFVYQNAPFSGYAAVDYLNQKRIPVVGGEGASPWFYSSPMFFPQASSGPLLTPVGLASTAELAGKQGKSKVAMISCVEAAICTDIDTNAPKMAPQFGLKVVYQGRASLTQPDFTSHCLSAQQAGADVLLSAMDGNSAIRIARSCASVGFKPIQTVFIVAVKTEFDKDPNMDGVIAALSVRPWFDSGHPAIAEFQTALKKHAPGLAPGVPQIYGWSAAKLFEAAGAKLPANATSADVLQGLWSIKNNDLGGLSSPLTFAEGQPVSRVVCAYPAQVKNGKWTGGQKVCI
jgi:ABC-type branched-subunit amino acid transport system substrate-binding protein